MIKPLSFEQFIYLGVGDNEAFQQAFKINSEQYTFVEADAEFIDTWQNNPSNNVNLTVLDKAVTTELDTSDEFKRFNLEEFNGFYQNPDLKDLYPGLKPTETMQVESMQFELLFKGIADNANTILWLDVPLQNDNFLKSLLKQDLAKKVNRLKFSWLDLTDDSVDETVLQRIKELEAAGFVLVCTEQKDEVIQFTLQKSHRAVQLAEKIKVLEENLAQQQSEVKNIAQSQSKKLEQLKADFEQAELQIQQYKVTTEKLNHAQDKSKENQQNLNLKIENLQKELEHSNTECQALITELDKVKTQIQSVTEERDHEQKRKDDEKVKNENLTQENTALCSENAAQKEQLAKLKQEHETLNSQFLALQKSQENIQDELKNNQARLKESQAKNTALTKEKEQLLSENKEYRIQFEVLKGELNKAEAQIDLIKDIFLKSNPSHLSKGK